MSLVGLTYLLLPSERVERIKQHSLEEFGVIRTVFRHRYRTKGYSCQATTLGVKNLMLTVARLKPSSNQFNSGRLTRWLRRRLQAMF